MPAGAPPREQMRQIQEDALREAGGKRLAENKLAAARLREAQEKNERALRAAAGGLEKGIKDADRITAVEGNIYQNANWNTVGHPEYNPALYNAQNDKRNRAEAGVMQAAEYSEKGYDTIAPSAAMNSIRANLERGVLATPGLADYYNGLTNPADQRKYLEGLLQDPTYRLRFNQNLQERVRAKRITDVDKKTRAGEIKVKNPTISDSDALTQAAGELEEEWVRSVENVAADTLKQTFDESVKSANDVVVAHADEIDAESASNVAKKAEKRWAGKRGKDIANKDFEVLTTRGVEEMLRRNGDIDQSEIDAIMKNPAIRTKYEGQIITSLAIKKLRQGKFTQAEFYKLIDNFGIDQVENIFQQHSKIQETLDKYKTEGYIQGDFWTNLKTLGTDQRKRIALMVLLGLIAGGGVFSVPLFMAAGGAGIAGTIGSAFYKG